jgi:hypothetical protein
MWWALLIGNATFTDAEIPNLKAPRHDVDALKALLEREDVGPYSIEELVDRPLLDVMSAIESFFDSANPEDLTLLYISGHGLKDSEGRLYFPTADTIARRLKARALDARFVVECMQLSRADQRVLLLDTCYSGAFAKGFGFKRGSTAVRKEDFEDAGSGSIIITASDAFQVAAETEEADADGAYHSIFSACLAEGIESGAADSAGTGKITLNDLYEYVRRAVRNTPLSQRAKKWELGLEGDFPIARNPRWRPDELPEDVGQLLQSSRFSERMEGLEGLLKLGRHKDANTRSLAIAKLREFAATDDSLTLRQFAENALSNLAPAKLDVESASEADLGVSQPSTAIPSAGAGPSATDAAMVTNRAAEPPRLADASARPGLAGTSGSAEKPSEPSTWSDIIALQWAKVEQLLSKFPASVLSRTYAAPDQLAPLPPPSTEADSASTDNQEDPSVRSDHLDANDTRKRTWILYAAAAALVCALIGMFTLFGAHRQPIGESGGIAATPGAAQVASKGPPPTHNPPFADAPREANATLRNIPAPPSNPAPPINSAPRTAPVETSAPASAPTVSKGSSVELERAERLLTSVAATCDGPKEPTVFDADADARIAGLRRQWNQGIQLLNSQIKQGNTDAVKWKKQHAELISENTTHIGPNKEMGPLTADGLIWCEVGD